MDIASVKSKITDCIYAAEAEKKQLESNVTKYGASWAETDQGVLEAETIEMLSEMTSSLTAALGNASDIEQHLKAIS